MSATLRHVDAINALGLLWWLRDRAGYSGPGHSCFQRSGLGHLRLELCKLACSAVGCDFRHFPLTAGG